MQSAGRMKGKIILLLSEKRKEAPKETGMRNRNALTIDTKQKDKYRNLGCIISARVYVKKEDIDQMFNPTP